MQVITTHDNADFDGVAAMLAAYRLHPDAVPLLPKKVGRNVRQFLALFKSGLPYVEWDDFRPSALIHRLILVDTDRAPEIRKLKPGTPLLIVDHHEGSGESLPAGDVTVTNEPVGAVTTLLVEQIRQRGDLTLSSLEASLLLLGIYSDTGTLTYGTTTPRDARAAAWLLEQGAVLDMVRRYLTAPLDERQRELLDKLVAHEESRRIQGCTVTVGAVAMDGYVDNINSVAHRLREMLDPDALFVLVQMPEHGSGYVIQLVARSRTDLVDAGAVARHFGGGGHARAAAAHSTNYDLESLKAAVWAVLEQVVQPVTRVADLMSRGVQTVEADTLLRDIITWLRRIGHEGYPVLADGQVVGLLTRRDADRALEHGLDDTRVRDVMSAGEVTLSPEASVTALEQLMVSSGWGQIPVVDEVEGLIGIVTRTDLIKHWAAAHPAAPGGAEYVDEAAIKRVLGVSLASLVERVAEHARERSLSVYLVGGVVRDLLLERPNDDVDFVVEGDAIGFAEAVCTANGGYTNSFRPFGTAKWILDDDVAASLGCELDDLPEAIDFATARNEFYEHPTALPSVYSGSIKLDLHRRDFTINTLAVQLSPAAAAMRLLDFYGGLNDLREGRIRVLHSLSFVDDPTRVLRAARFEHRLGFEIEARTYELIRSALPMLYRITGERVRNEIKMLMREPEPEVPLRTLDERGVLAAIHPDFAFSEVTAADFQEARATHEDWPTRVDKLRHLYWHLIMLHVPPDRVHDLAARLLFGHNIIESYEMASRLHHEPGALADPAAPVSQIVRRLEGLRDVALLAAWVHGGSLRRERIAQYIASWHAIRPYSNGDTLKAMGLKPGPGFRVILQALRDAWLDGTVTDWDGERALLATLIEEQTE